jgi:hypothetical protein
MLFLTDEAGYLFVRDRRGRTTFICRLTMNSVTDEAGDVVPDKVGYIYLFVTDEAEHLLFIDFTMNSVTDEAGSFSPKTGEALGILCGSSCCQIYAWRTFMQNTRRRPFALLNRRFSTIQHGCN